MHSLEISAQRLFKRAVKDTAYKGFREGTLVGLEKYDNLKEWEVVGGERGYTENEIMVRVVPKVGQVRYYRIKITEAM